MHEKVWAWSGCRKCIGVCGGAHSQRLYAPGCGREATANSLNFQTLPSSARISQKRSWPHLPLLAFHAEPQKGFYLPFPRPRLGPGRSHSAPHRRWWRSRPRSSGSTSSALTSDLPHRTFCKRKINDLTPHSVFKSPRQVLQRQQKCSA